MAKKAIPSKAEEKPEEKVDPLELIYSTLSAPFPPSQIKWRLVGKTFSGSDGTRAMCVPYIDARDVFGRLDDAVGPGNWQTSHELVEGPAAGVICTLSLFLSAERDNGVLIPHWVGKADGSEFGDGSDGFGEKLKAAISGAIRRAAVQWGVGRYLYSLPQTWFKLTQQKTDIFIWRDKQAKQSWYLARPLIEKGNIIQQRAGAKQQQEPEPQQPADQYARPDDVVILEGRLAMRITELMNDSTTNWAETIPKITSAIQENEVLDQLGKARLMKRVVDIKKEKGL